MGAAGRVAIIGGGFIGTEVASILVTRGLEVTVVDAALPFAPVLGVGAAPRSIA